MRLTAPFFVLQLSFIQGKWLAQFTKYKKVTKKNLSVEYLKKCTEFYEKKNWKGSTFQNICVSLQNDVGN